MQDKHILITHYNEDRDIFINKVKYPKTIFHVGNDPQPGDIVRDKKEDLHRFFAEWIIDNYNNLPEYVVLCQANPYDHVHEPLLALDATFKSDFGSLSFARAIHNQFSLGWDGNFLLPLQSFINELGYGFHNDLNTLKPLYFFFPGEANFISRKRILEKPISFYQKFIEWDDCDKIIEFTKKQKFSSDVYNVLLRNYKHLEHLSVKEKIQTLTNKIENKNFGHIGLVIEPLWLILFGGNELFNLLEKSQAAMGNKLYFNTKLEKYNLNFKFELFPYSYNLQVLRDNMVLLENDWFDYDCPYYKKWKEKLIERVITESNKHNKDGRLIIEHYQKIGYKHISM